MAPVTSVQLTRRAVIAGGASAVLLAACGGSSSKGTSANSGSNSNSSSSSDSSATKGGKYALVSFFGDGAVRTGIPQRLTFGVGDSQGILLDSAPASIDVTIATPDGKVITRPGQIERHNSGLSRAYFPIAFTPPAAGNYIAHAIVNGQPVDAAFSVGTAADVPIPQAGDKCPLVATPTVANAQGVDPICTRSPVCPLHSVSLTDAIAAKRRVALLMSTPAFCQVGICGPVLEVLLKAQPGYAANIDFIHAEVYASGKAAAAGISTAALAPVLQAFHLPFEPCLVLVHADGTIAERLDTIFDATELDAALKRLAA